MACRRQSVSATVCVAHRLARQVAGGLGGRLRPPVGSRGKTPGGGGQGAKPLEAVEFVNILRAKLSVTMHKMCTKSLVYIIEVRGRSPRKLWLYLIEI